MNREIVERALSVQHPEGWVSQMSSSKLIRPRTRPRDLPGDGREAAVMILLFEAVNGSNGSLCTVLTKRKEHLQHHPGQISLPGGRRELGESLADTSVREVEEEIGVPKEKIEIVGSLNAVYVPPSDFTITPYIGWINEKPEFRLQAEEVAVLIHVSMASVLDRSNRKHSVVNNDKEKREVPHFLFGKHQVWGATAIILDDFVQRIESLKY